MSEKAALEWVGLDRHLPQRVEILDFYHVLERVAEVARAMHPDADADSIWPAEMKSCWRLGRGSCCVGCGRGNLNDAGVQEVRRVQLGYFERQQERLRYPECRRRGLPIGSGAARLTQPCLALRRFAATTPEGGSSLPSAECAGGMGDRCLSTETSLAIYADTRSMLYAH